MIDVEMSDDIRKYEPKVAAGLTQRELTCICVGLVIDVPVALLLPLSISNKIFAAFIIAIPIAMCGFIKMDGTYLEIFILRLLYLKVLTPAKRKMKRKNLFRKDMDEYKKEKEKLKLAQMTAEQRKQYTEMKNKKIVKYSSRKEYKIYT